ncbi:class I SAM-dependent methyltransferase [Tardiphaga sp.]|jgi:ubiquinone/menaquinone biosynthesis C-methylase UbiE|uniref:class I SAM-dependent methyltransferase n=1 Tax=Tardiphaga sp. TaxID=1926292 RepID=UPI0037D9C8FE
MEDWIDYYDSTHTIYASKLHRDVHFELIARDIIGYIPSRDATVLDYACGEALSAGKVTEACAKLILAEPAPKVRERVAARFAANPKIAVHSLDELRDLPAGSVDLAIMNSVAQYMTLPQLEDAFTVVKRLLKPDGRLVVGDILPPDLGMMTDVMALLRLGAKHGFLWDALVSLVKTALSDYRQLRTTLGLQHYAEADMLAKLAAAGYRSSRAKINIGHNQARMTFVAQPMDAVQPMD